MPYTNNADQFFSQWLHPAVPRNLISSYLDNFILNIQILELLNVILISPGISILKASQINTLDL